MLTSVTTQPDQTL